LAELGHTVIGVDRDQSKVKSINAGHAPFYEPGLEALVENGIRTRNLRATTSAGEALPEADVVLVCVGTPSERNGNLGLDQLRRS
jgi:GDP-mannose 6-dehydrogenase